MAGDWLKIQVSLPDKPEVWQMAGILAINADEVVGKLIRVWRWFDAHTEDGHATRVTFPLLDHVAGATGFAEAMQMVGWLEESGTDIRLPHFDRHNGKTAKNRALATERKAAERSRNERDISVTREEKRREEKKEQKTAPKGDLLDGIDEQVATDFKALRSKLRAPITATAMAGIEREAIKAGLSMQEALRVCCERGWRGFKAEWMEPAKVNGSKGGKCASDEVDDIFRRVDR